METLLSIVSKQFGKSLILGTFLPGVIFVGLTLIFVAPFFTAADSLLNSLSPIDVPQLVLTMFEPLTELTTQGALIILFATVLLTGLLYTLNEPLIRLYEGYPWIGSRIGRWRRRHYQAQFDFAHARWRGMRTLMYELASRGDKERRQTIATELLEKGNIVNNRFPSIRGSVLPTRLGNAIRSFENYPRDRYSMSAIPLYPRLVAKIDKEHAAAIGDVKTSFDFMINTSALSALLVMELLVFRVLRPTSLSEWPLHFLWLLLIALFAALAYLFYYWAIGRAVAWGDMVKGAFDLYRWDLLEQLGYKRLPTTAEEEHKTWNDISQRVLYGESPRIPLSNYAALPTFAQGKPSVGNLKVTRGVSLPSPDESVKVTLSVKNEDKERKVEKITVTDTLPDQFDYVWASAQRIGKPGAITVTGVNPYHFEIGTLTPEEEVRMTYLVR